MSIELPDSRQLSDEVLEALHRGSFSVLARGCAVCELSALTVHLASVGVLSVEG